MISSSSPRPGDTDPTIVVATADGSPGKWPATADPHRWNSDVRGARSALFRSWDGAQSWQRIGAGQGLPDEMHPMIWALCEHPWNPNAIFAGVGEVSAGHAWGSAGRGSVLLSGDRGESWRTVSQGIPAVRDVAAAAA